MQDTTSNVCLVNTYTTFNEYYTESLEELN